MDQFQLDVLITHSTLWNGPEEVAKFVEWRRGMRSIGGYTDSLVFCQMAHFQEPSNRYSLLEQTFRMAWNKVAFPQIFSAANLLLVVTDLEKKAKVKMGADPNKCFLFPGGIDDEMLCYTNIEVNSMLKRLNVQDDVKIISYLGSLEERKNPLAFLEIAKLFQGRKDMHFVIAGRGDSAYATKVVETAKGLSNVTYLGEINEKEKVQLIKVSYLNVLLSKLEALGLAQLEFMFFGVPIITSGVSGQAWLIRDNVEGIHVNGPEDVKGATAAINRLIDDQDFWHELSTNAKKRAMDLTTSNLTSKLDEALTKELMKARGLTKLPPEIRATMEEPETVIKSWSFGSWGVVATEKRLFIKSGFISRKVTEIPYSNISSIEYTRRYAWKTLTVGAAISGFLLIVPFLEPIFSRAFLGWLAPILESQAFATFFDELSIFPFVASVLVFILQARVGFTLRGPGINALYLPGRFGNAISFIRKMQNGENEQRNKATIK